MVLEVVEVVAAIDSVVDVDESEAVEGVDDATTSEVELELLDRPAPTCTNGSVDLCSAATDVDEDADDEGLADSVGVVSALEDETVEDSSVVVGSTKEVASSDVGTEEVGSADIDSIEMLSVTVADAAVEDDDETSSSTGVGSPTLAVDAALLPPTDETSPASADEAVALSMAATSSPMTINPSWPSTAHQLAVSQRQQVYARSMSNNCLDDRDRRLLDLRPSAPTAVGSAATCATTSASKAKAHNDGVRRLIRMIERMCRLYASGESIVRRVIWSGTTGM